MVDTPNSGNCDDNNFTPFFRVSWREILVLESAVSLVPIAYLFGVAVTMLVVYHLVV